MSIKKEILEDKEMDERIRVCIDTFDFDVVLKYIRDAPWDYYMKKPTTTDELKSMAINLLENIVNYGEAPQRDDKYGFFATLWEDQLELMFPIQYSTWFEGWEEDIE